ncbi:hypothetical protein TrRE_jg7276, partial [Triparma retinervis]
MIILYLKPSSLAGTAQAAYVGGFLLATPRMNRRRTTTNSIDRTGFWPFPDLPNNTIPGSCEILRPFLNSSINNILQFHTNTTGKVKRDRFKFCFAPDNLHNCPSLAAAYDAYRNLQGNANILADEVPGGVAR